MTRVLHLNLKAEYFQQIADGCQPFEFRLRTPYWTKQLLGMNFDQVHIKNGYPPASGASRVIVRPRRGVELQTISHPHFGADPVEMFAIRVGE